MKYIEWDEEKNKVLKRERGVSFEDVLTAINDNGLIVTVNNPNRIRYPEQKMYIVAIDDYAYMVPFVEDDKKRFLKTIIPSRKMTKKYLQKDK